MTRHLTPFSSLFIMKLLIQKTDFAVVCAIITGEGGHFCWLFVIGFECLPHAGPIVLGTRCLTLYGYCLVLKAVRNKLGECWQTARTRLLAVSQTLEERVV